MEGYEGLEQNRVIKHLLRDRFGLVFSFQDTASPHTAQSLKEELVKGVVHNGCWEGNAQFTVYRM